MKRYTITLLLSGLAALVLLVSVKQFSPAGAVLAQKRPARPAATTPAPRAGTKDYSKFSHSTKEHGGECKSCHKTPTANSQQVRGFPDVADFPDHASCLGPCHDHRNEFFKGAQPPICSACHEKTSPRDSKRLAFPNLKRLTQFTNIFPHDKHQDVLASLRPLTKSKLFGSNSLVKSAHAFDDKTKKYNYCQICHDASKPPVAPSGGWPDQEVVEPDTFKTSPDSHASCFNCHWSGQEPTKDNCKGCHRLAATPYSPLPNPTRISLKFRHGTVDGTDATNKAHFTDNCTKCHINITKPELKGDDKSKAKPSDVQIFPSCTDGCHRDELKNEMKQYKAPGGFTCKKCHTSDVAKKPLPESHNQALKQQ